MTQLCSPPYLGSPYTSSLSIVRQQRERSAGTYRRPHTKQSVAISSRACLLGWLTLQVLWSQPSSCPFRLRLLHAAFPLCVLAPPAVPYVPLCAGLLDASSPSLCAHP